MEDFETLESGRIFYAPRLGFELSRLRTPVSVTGIPGRKIEKRKLAPRRGRIGRHSLPGIGA